MTKPTQQSLDEAARVAGSSDWKSASQCASPLAKGSITAHALTLDQLHGRKELSEPQEFWAELLESRYLRAEAANVRCGKLDIGDESAIALIEAKFAELLARAPQEPEWIEWHGGKCPVPAGSDCEVRFDNGNIYRDRTPEGWDWGECGTSTITHYRVWSS